jgi:hypothetical protein
LAAAGRPSLRPSPWKCPSPLYPVGQHRPTLHTVSHVANCGELDTGFGFAAQVQENLGQFISVTVLECLPKRFRNMPRFRPPTWISALSRFPAKRLRFVWISPQCCCLVLRATDRVWTDCQGRLFSWTSVVQAARLAGAIRLQPSRTDRVSFCRLEKLLGSRNGTSSRSPRRDRSTARRPSCLGCRGRLFCARAY